MFSQLSHLLCCESGPSFPTPYRFFFGGESWVRNSQIFQGNGVRTTKYNVFNFLPKSIITQYRRLANLYFLIVAIISTIPNVTPLNPGLIWAPLVLVLVLSLAKELYEDYNRFRTDEQVNDENEVAVLRGGRLQIIKWKEVVVGDLCRVKENETFPADLVIVSSSDKDGVAFIETATLDGQLTSKTRYAFQQLNIFVSQDELTTLNGTFQAASPSYSLAQFRGTLWLGEQRLSMSDNSQLLFRGAKLKNTEWVWGMAVYTGQCSKIMMNGQNYTTKLSSLERKLNYLLVLLLIAQTVVCFIIAALSIRSQRAMMDSHNYLHWQSKTVSGSTFIMNFLMFFIEFSSSIPVSLIVTIEIAKTAQSYFIDFDQLMFSSWRKKKTFARIASLNEELGQVEYVFCDKTGTLTKNLLKFHTAVVAGTSYEFAYDEGTKRYSCERMVQALSGGRRIEDRPSELGNHTEVLELYLLGLMVCNNVSTVGEECKYESESPDEIALISMAKDMGFQLLKRDKNAVVVNVLGVTHKIEVVGKFNFTSERKRMSVIVKWNGNFILFTKGADNIVLERAETPHFNVASSIDRLSYQGLRSLLLSYRALTSSQVQNFIADLQSAPMEEKQIVRDHYSDEFQCKLTIIGATGLLDELQDGVPETLKDLQRAGVKVWMLTGDKLETALEVGKSCNLVEADYDVVLMRDTVVSIKEQFLEIKRRLAATVRKCSLIIQGSILAMILNSPEMAKQFSQLTLFFESVICCRLLPVQKSQVVKLVKENLQKVCLAVGDGGNDVSMLKQASIGVGLYGEEGMSAVQASDYAIPEFRMLWRLLFVHGRWNYIRISEMVLYFVYKSLLFTIPRILFQFDNAYSGSPIYDDYYIAGYNVVFTALPLLIRALFQQDFNYVVKGNEDSDGLVGAESIQEQRYLPKGYVVNVGVRKLFPKIYFIGQNSICFNLKECFFWVVEALLMGGAIYFIIRKGLGTKAINQAGLNNNFSFLSLTIYTAVVIVVTVKLCMQVKHWTRMLFFTIVVLSIGPYIAFMWVMNFYFNRPVGRILYICFSTAKGYYTVFFLIIVLVAINGILNFMRFRSHRILKRMAIALEEDHEMLSFLSSQRDASVSGDVLRCSHNTMKEKPMRLVQSQGIV